MQEEIKHKLTEADITYNESGKRTITKVYESEAGSYLTNPRNLVRRKLSGRQRKRMFKQSYKLKKIEEGIKEVNKNNENKTTN